MSTWHRIGTEGEPLTDPLTTQAIAALSRGHGLFAGGVSGADIDAPQIQQYANAISWVANAVPTAAAYRWRGAARALRRLANTDEALAQIMAAAQIDHAHARTATRALLEAAKTDAMALTDTPLGRRGGDGGWPPGCGLSIGTSRDVGRGRGYWGCGCAGCATCAPPRQDDPR